MRLLLLTVFLLSLHSCAKSTFYHSDGRCVEFTGTTIEENRVVDKKECEKSTVFNAKNLMAAGFVLFIIAAAFGAFFVVPQNSVGLVERFGKYVRTGASGLNFKIPLIESVDEIDLRVGQLNVDVETKTKDNVFLKVKISTQHKVIDPFKANYTLDDPEEQMSSYIFDVVRAEVPKITLDEVFDKKDEIAKAVKGQLSDTMDDFGIGIIQALITDIDPNEEVKVAMNSINANARMRVAMTEKAEADKILKVKEAEAESESKRLQGEGIAAQRKAIVDGLRSGMEEFKAAVPGVDPETVMAMILTTQYFDTLKELGDKGSATIMLPHQPGGISDIREQMLSALSVKKRS